jgi:hypothetical protein
MTATRRVRLSLLALAAALVACGQGPHEFATPDTLGQNAARGDAGKGPKPAAVAPDLALAARQSAGLAIEGRQSVSSTDSGGIAAAAPANQDAEHRSPEQRASEPPTPVAAPLLNADGSAMAGPAVGADGKALTAPERPADEVKAPGNLSAQGGTKPRKPRKGGLQAACCGWGSVDVADRLSGYLGFSFANLYYDDWYGTIEGYLDGRRVYIEDGDEYLYGSIGPSTINLQRTSGWWNDTISGYLGAHAVRLTVGSRRLKGYEGGLYFNTGTSWDGRTLTGSYNGGRVSVSNSNSYLSGYLGYRAVRIAGGWSTYGGYLGSKTINVYADMAPSVLLRRLPLLAANDWMVISALTEFFD